VAQAGRLVSALILSALLALFAVPVTAQTFPPLSGQVVDAANVIPADQEAKLTADLQALARDKGLQFVIATIPSLEGYAIEDYGYRLGRHWAIGRKGIDDGVILIVAPTERKVRIEVGYGLTPVLTAGLSGAIIADAITPRFKAGDLPGGIRAGADEILTQLRLPAPQAEARAKRILAEQAKKQEGAGDWFGILFWIVVLLVFVVPPFFRRGSGRRYRGGGGPVVIWGPSSSSWGSGSSGSNWGGGGGGGFSGGGGSFGGGGASGSW